MDTLKGKLSAVGGISGKLSGVGALSGRLSNPTIPAHYTGSVVITPTQAAQTLETAGLTLDENITVNPIPNNYGLISYNGGIITVS